MRGCCLDNMTIGSCLVALGLATGALVLWRGTMNRGHQSAASEPEKARAVRTETGSAPLRAEATVAARQILWSIPAATNGPQYEPTWIGFIPGRFVLGPYKDRDIALRAANNAGNVVDKVECDSLDFDSIGLVCMCRNDLSSPPFHVFEFTLGPTCFFAVLGPLSWVGATTLSPVEAREYAASLAASERQPSAVKPLGYRK